MFPNEAPGPDAILVPEPEIGRKFILIGKTRVPFGTLVRLQGVVFEGDGKGSESGSNMFIESIDGKTCQERIALESLYHGGLHLQNGKRYELVGYESGGFTGIPFQARAALVSLIQSDDFHFHTTFFVLNEKLLEEK